MTDASYLTTMLRAFAGIQSDCADTAWERSRFYSAMLRHLLELNLPDTEYWEHFKHFVGKQIAPEHRNMAGKIAAKYIVNSTEA